MKIKTSELKGAALDWAVLEATGFFKGYTQFRSGKNFLKVYGVARSKHLHPSTDWSQGGPIIEREEISLHTTPKFAAQCMKWDASQRNINGACVRSQFGPTPLIAAMRCYCSAELGDEVDVPEELK